MSTLSIGRGGGGGGGGVGGGGVSDGGVGEVSDGGGVGGGFGFDVPHPIVYIIRERTNRYPRFI